MPACNCVVSDRMHCSLPRPIVLIVCAFVYAVVDKYGMLWTGSGPFLYGAAGTYSVLRFDTSIATANDAAKPILAVTITDDATVRTGWHDTVECPHDCVQLALSCLCVCDTKGFGNDGIRQCCW